MIIDDPTDKAYAQACKSILDKADTLSEEDIEEEFIKTSHKFFPDYETQPKNVMLREVHTGVLFDELDPSFPQSVPDETLKRFKKIIEDYLSGNYYPSYFSLSGSYSDSNQGYTLDIQIKDGKLAVVCGNDNVANSLRKITDKFVLTGQDETDLGRLQKDLPEKIENLVLTSSELEEYLT